jgi:hypothetical protein
MPGGRKGEYSRRRPDGARDAWFCHVDPVVQHFTLSQRWNVETAGGFLTQLMMMYQLPMLFGDKWSERLCAKIPNMKLECKGAGSNYVNRTHSFKNIEINGNIVYSKWHISDAHNPLWWREKGGTRIRFTDYILIVLAYSPELMMIVMMFIIRKQCSVRILARSLTILTEILRGFRRFL